MMTRYVSKENASEILDRLDSKYNGRYKRLDSSESWDDIEDKPFSLQELDATEYSNDVGNVTQLPNLTWADDGTPVYGVVIGSNVGNSWSPGTAFIDVITSYEATIDSSYNPYFSFIPIEHYDAYSESSEVVISDNSSNFHPCGFKYSEYLFLQYFPNVNGTYISYLVAIKTGTRSTADSPNYGMVSVRRLGRYKTLYWRYAMSRDCLEPQSGLAINSQSKLLANVDNDTIKVNSNGQLYVDIPSLMGVSY